MKHTVFFLTALLATTFAVNAQGLGVGFTTENFSLPDLNGKAQTLGDLKGQKGAVVIFLSAQCPAVKGYKDRINQAAAEAQAKGITFIGINSNSNEPMDLIRSNAVEFGYKFPILIDKGNVVADKLGAQATPEVYFINGENILLYRGAIDNDREGSIVTEPYLRSAFESALNGKPIMKKTSKAIGCSIKRIGEALPGLSK